MIKIIIGVFITLATIIFISITFYWRDTFYNPTEKDIIQYFLGLPVVLTFSILSPYFIYKIMQKHKKSQLENQDEVANRQAIQVTEKKENRVPKNSQAFKLNIYSSTAWHNFGENEEIIERIENLGIKIRDIFLDYLNEIIPLQEYNMNKARLTQRFWILEKLFAFGYHNGEVNNESIKDFCGDSPIFNDGSFTLHSADNTSSYKNVYYSDNDDFNNKIAVRTFENIQDLVYLDDV